MITKETVKKLERLELIRLYWKLKQQKYLYEDSVVYLNNDAKETYNDILNDVSIVVDELRARRVWDIT